jgi:D-alanine-D-alanine ligase
MSEKTVVGLIFGGKSCEHEISVISALNVLDHIDNEKYEVICIGIDIHGNWFYSKRENINSLIESGVVTGQQAIQITIDISKPGTLLDVSTSRSILPVIDVYFPVIHGTFGEDGTLQGLLDMTDTPYTGCGLEASANGMNKIISKKLFADANIPQCDYFSLTYQELLSEPSIATDIEKRFGYPLFVKPARTGSSVGVMKSCNNHELNQAIENAFKYDDSILIEPSFENGYEVECAVLGGNPPKVSTVGFITMQSSFYDFETKYVNSSAKITIPAPLDPDVIKKIQHYSVAAFQAINGVGLSRVDFFVNKENNNDLVINEINTLPGFTENSMYLQLWNASGVSSAEVIDHLISLAITHHQEKKRIKTMR